MREKNLDFCSDLKRIHVEYFPSIKVLSLKFYSNQQTQSFFVPSNPKFLKDRIAE